MGTQSRGYSTFSTLQKRRRIETFTPFALLKLNATINIAKTKNKNNLPSHVLNE
jgi:hypothetical protein